MQNIVMNEILKLRDQKEKQLERAQEEIGKYEESLESKKRFIKKLETEVDEINAVLNLINVKTNS